MILGYSCERIAPMTLQQRDYFAADNFIGQERAKSQLNFFIAGQRTSGYFNPVLLSAARGYGKTMLAKLVGKNLITDKGERKPCLNVNGATIKKVENFVDEIVRPYVNNGAEVTLHIDEIHCVGVGVLNFLLSVLVPDDNLISSVDFRGETFVFDFKRFSFLGSTTNSEKLSKPLISRLRKVTLEPYNHNDLKEILIRNSKKVNYEDTASQRVVQIVRGSPRETIHRAHEITQYCEQRNYFIFGDKQWEEYRKIMGIFPLGLTTQEVEVLKFLNETGPQSLTAIAGKLSIDFSTVRRDIELFLLNNNLLKIAGKREITIKGRDVLKECLL